LKRNSKIVIEFFFIGTIKNNELNLRKKGEKRKLTTCEVYCRVISGKKYCEFFKLESEKERERERERERFKLGFK